MVHYYIYAKDYSSSTNRVDYYHKNGLKTLSQFKKDVDKIKQELSLAGEPQTESKIVYLHWGTRCTEVDEKKTRKAYLCKEGCEGTDPAVIIDWLQAKNISFGVDDTIKLLYIITDGEIAEYSVNTCFEKNENMHYEKVIFHAFNRNLRSINLSVAASFLKQHCIVYRNYKLYDNIDISTEFDYDKINLLNFEAEKEQLKSYIKLKFIGKCKQDSRALQEIENLKNLRKRLFQELTLKSKESENLLSGTKELPPNATNSEHKKINLETKDRNEFLREFIRTEWYQKLNEPVNMEKAGIEKAISTFINYIVSETKSYSFDALKFDKKFDKSVEEEVINEDVKFTIEQEIEFPDVILDDEKGIPVIILTEFSLMDKIIFHKTQSPKTRLYRNRSKRIKRSKQVTQASYGKFESAMECPLYLLDGKGISNSIGYFYTLNVYKQFLAHNTKIDPRTRKPFHGGLVLTDTNLFDKYNDYIVSATYFNCKKINYNTGLFYFVLWKNCEKLKWMDRNVVELFKKYSFRRIRETVCRIGLSSMPMDPKLRTSLPTALWYCVEMSSCIFKNDPKNFKHERLRRYHNVVPYMIEILKSFNYDLNLETIEKRRELISEVMILKRIRKYKDKVYFLLQKIFKTVDGFLVSEIENPSHLYKLNFLKLNHKEMLRDVFEEKVHLNDFVHLMYFEGTLEASRAGESTFEICEKSFRPFYMIDQNKSFHGNLIKNVKKTVINNDDDPNKIEVTYEKINSLEFERVLSRYKLFIDCVKETEKFPTLSEYVEYISKKKKFKGNSVTIFPPNVYFDIKNVHELYQNVVGNVDVKEFIKVCKSGVNRNERIKAEGRVLFDSWPALNKVTK